MYAIKTVDLESGRRKTTRKPMTKKEARGVIDEVRKKRRKGSAVVSSIVRVVR
jgi:hypothetical protein